ncbi:flagellar biosynthesis protein FlhA [Desulfobacter sp.]|uniref:flagellar biosynthesis protein FlhA n=1 Tax=Desulfobacter sp. TaxID=2294 RepID=UPI000E909A80|nr:flagellar biosynthesis protein FlhA [Desulfobacter sp.]MBP9597533.1 flagellar biosynthesis protein FlhA [Desulfobacter sp.]HBT89957.1 flagellar biosynthesis protein FlhA [Desulfobacter sp.]
MAAENVGIMATMKKESSDILMVLAFIGILMAMILPLHPIILDFFLALNISLAVVVLITTMYTQKPLDFSIFPSLLLMLTLFRLSLNVASTRLILLHGSEGPEAAGSIIMSFGAFVVGGNYVVGLIIFIILVLINFMVITKGAGRIAEVAARFTLDAMPGKQMAIDADLNAGMIDEIEARERRAAIARESEFHGAMDGASKFVRGDAIAGIVITLINIGAGFLIGVVQQGMPLGEALTNYTLLTVGDGLVSQIPALLISAASGLLVSRSGADSKMGQAFAKHLFSSTTPVMVGAVVVFLIGVIPGLPTIPFMTLGITMGTIAWYFLGQEEKKEEEKQQAVEKAQTQAQEETPGKPEDVDHLLRLDTMELEVGYGLIPLVDKQQDGTLLGRIKAIRRQFATEMGIIVPPIHIRDNLNLSPAQYRLMIKGVETAGAELMVNHYLAMDPGGAAKKIDGIDTVEPAFNLPALWIPMSREEEAKFSGYTVVDNSTVIATHLTEIIRNNAHNLLSRQDVQHLLDNLAKTSPKVVEELVPNLLSVGAVQKVLQNLLRERVSIRDLLTIVETLADFAPAGKDPDLLTEYVRQRVAKGMLAPYLQPGKKLQVMTLDRKLEEILTKNIKRTDHGTYLALEPVLITEFVGAVSKQVEKVITLNTQPVLMTSPTLRRHVRRLIEPSLPNVFVVSHAEIVDDINLQAVGKVTLKNG